MGAPEGRCLGILAAALKALIDVVRDVYGPGTLRPKPPRRKHITHRRILRPLLLRHGPDRLRKLLRPPRMIWPLIAESVSVGGRGGGWAIFADIYSCAPPNQAIRAKLPVACFAYSGQISPRCRRRGDTRELLNAGSPTRATKSA